MITRLDKNLSERAIDLWLNSSRPPGLDRRDEIAVIAEATRLCRDSVITAAQTAAERESEQQQAKRKRRRKLDGLNEQFQGTASELVSTLLSAAANLRANAETMSQATRATGDARPGDSRVLPSAAANQDRARPRRSRAYPISAAAPTHAMTAPAGSGTAARKARDVRLSDDGLRRRRDGLAPVADDMFADRPRAEPGIR